MATNKNASYRYRVIDNCLRNTARKWTLNDLIETISEKLEEDQGIYKGVSKRTVQNDISIMRSPYPRGYDAPIICKDGFYSYRDPKYSIDKLPLNEKDIKSVREAINILKQFKTIPVFEELQRLVLKLEGTILENTKINRKIIDFEKIENASGTEHIKPFYELIRDRKVVEIKYQPFNKDDSLHMIIHPYLLKEYNNRWFLIGFNDKIRKMSHLPLDRIQSFTNTKRVFEIMDDFDEGMYFQHILGITIPENTKPEIIELSFTPNRAPYVKTKPIHSSQNILIEDEKGLTIQLKMVINKELVSLLLGFGNDIIVIKPETLKKDIGRILSDALKNFE